MHVLLKYYVSLLVILDSVTKITFVRVYMFSVMFLVICTKIDACSSTSIYLFALRSLVTPYEAVGNVLSVLMVCQLAFYVQLTGFLGAP